MKTFKQYLEDRQMTSHGAKCWCWLQYKYKIWGDFGRNNKLRQKDPHTVYKFEELLFANMRPGFTLKYVGQEPIQVKSIDTFEDGHWRPIER